MTNLDLAIAAWSAVRKPDDAPWEKLPLGIKAKLIDLAGKYRSGAKVAEGDYPPEGFAEKVVESSAQPVRLVDGRTVETEELVGKGIISPDFLPTGQESVKGTIGVESDENGTSATVNVNSAEHEDVNIPSPNPEDVDPLKEELAPAPEVDDADALKESEAPAEPSK